MPRGQSVFRFRELTRVGTPQVWRHGGAAALPQFHLVRGDGADPVASPAVAALVAMTEEARRALSGRHAVRIARFPFNVGRESRSTRPGANPPSRELRLNVAPPNNDLYLLEPASAEMPHISREHFSIERIGSRLFVVDRGSVCGTIVAGTHIGGSRAGGRAQLNDGDLIVVGPSSLRFVFRFEVLLND